MILIISGEQNSNKLSIALNLQHHAKQCKFYDEFPATKPADFPNTNKVLVIISTVLDAEYPAWINDHAFLELQTKPPLHSIQYYQSRIA